MSATLITLFILVLLLVIQNLMVSSLLRELETHDPATHERLDLHSENFWNHAQPLRISFSYILPGAYDRWSLGVAGRRLADWLRIVSVGVIVSSLAVVGMVFVDIF